MRRRQALLNELVQSIAQHRWQLVAECSFRILYGLPADLQIRLTIFMMQRYLPIFEYKWPTIKWPQQILNDVAQWASLHGRCVPDEPSTLDAADAAFSFSFDGLLLAYAYQSYDFTLTVSAACAIHSAINARETNVWIADEPKAYQVWQRGEWCPERVPPENPATVAVAEREWNEVASLMRQEEVWTYPDEVTREKMEQDLARWKRHEMLLIVPGINLEALRNQDSKLKKAA